jgi:transposase
MIQITPQTRILVAIEAVDGRKGIDSLARLCQEKLQTDPFSGCLFVFRSRRGTALRIFEQALTIAKRLPANTRHALLARLDRVTEPRGAANYQVTPGYRLGMRNAL